MDKKKKTGAFFVGLALLGMSTLLTLPACQSSQQSQKAVTVVSLKVEGAKTEYYVGEKFSRSGMTVTAVKSDGTEEEVDDYYFSPTKALKLEDKVVTIYYEDVTYDLAITVREKGVESLDVDVSSVNLEVNGKYQLNVTVLPDDATNTACDFVSNDTNVATVNENGLITATGIGETTITVSTKSSGPNGSPLTKTVAVTVSPTATTGLEIDVDDIILLVNEEKQIGVTILPTNATNKAVTFSSSDATVASVSDTGLVKALKEGDATITVTTDAKGSDNQPFVQSFEVTVIDANTKFAVAFRNTDGTLIQGYKAEDIAVGQVPAFTKSAPRKATDSNGVYVFRGFDKEIVPYAESSEEITYTAVYQTRRYTVTAVDLKLDGEKLVYSVTGTSVDDSLTFDMRNMFKGGSYQTTTVKQMEPMSYLADGSWVLKADLLDEENSFLMDSLGTPFIGKFRCNTGDAGDEDLKILIRNDALRYRHTATGEVIEVKDLADDWDGVTGYDSLSDDFKNAIPAPTWDGLNIAYEDTTINVGGYEYTLYANEDTWNCISLICRKEGSIDAKVTPAAADVELINEKPYYVVSGTFTGNFTLDQYWKAYGINLQHHGSLGFSDWDYVLGDKTNKFDFDKELSSFDVTTHEFTAKFFMDPALFGDEITGVFLGHSVLNGGEADNLKVTAGTNVIQAGGYQYEILKNSDTWNICCLKVTALGE